MPNVIFTKGANTFTFSHGRVFPLDDPAQVNVPVDYSEGGQMYAYDKGIEEQFFNLVFERLPQADYDEVEDWLLNIAMGPKNIFTYTDEDGNTHTVRMLDTKTPLREMAFSLYSGTIHLREEL